MVQGTVRWLLQLDIPPHYQLKQQPKISQQEGIGTVVIASSEVIAAATMAILFVVKLTR